VRSGGEGEASNRRVLIAFASVACCTITLSPLKVELKIMSKQPGLIEVGAADEDGTIDYWIAKESVRQGEILLANQIGLRAMYNSSATSILG
jgi:hypothetical protein